MHFDWLIWSNPVALWWTFLVTVSALNIALLVVLRAAYRANPFGAANTMFALASIPFHPPSQVWSTARIESGLPPSVGRIDVLSLTCSRLR